MSGELPDGSDATEEDAPNVGEADASDDVTETVVDVTNDEAFLEPSFADEIPTEPPELPDNALDSDSTVETDLATDYYEPTLTPEDGIPEHGASDDTEECISYLVAMAVGYGLAVIVIVALVFVIWRYLKRPRRRSRFDNPMAEDWERTPKMEVIQVGGDPQFPGVNNLSYRTSEVQVINLPSIQEDVDLSLKDLIHITGLTEPNRRSTVVAH